MSVSGAAHAAAAAAADVKKSGTNDDAIENFREGLFWGFYCMERESEGIRLIVCS